MKHIFRRYSLIEELKSKKISLLIIVIIFFLSTLLVYLTGGTRNSYLHIIYIPIIISAFFYKKAGGLISGVIAGLLMGPIMPINTETMLMQPTLNWIFRMFFFVLIGVLTGFLFNLIERQLNKINKIAYYDQDSGLPNKVNLRKVVNQKIKKGEKFHLMILSIKNYSDIYKLIGSEKFSDFIPVMINHIVEYGSAKSQLYYLNDSKYATLLSRLEKKDLIKRLKKFNDYLNSPVDFKEISIFTDIVIGVSTYSKDGEKFDELLEKAFLAVDKVQEKKVNFWIYEKKEFDIAYNNIELLGDINESLKKDYFELYYQPKVNLKTNKIDTFEALLRWNHPQKGFIPPDEFIPKVEKSSLIEPLTKWVIKRCISDVKEYKSSEDKMQMNIAINISARNFQEPDFVNNFIDHIKSAGLSPQKFAIEITETDLMIDMESNKDKLGELRRAGVQIYLDDFGKGYSSFKYLKKLPIDFVKIDKFFIDDISEDQVKQDIVSSMIRMSHLLDIEVVAEGVEQKQQLELLKKINCDYAQGYYYIKPDKKQKIIEWTNKYNKSNGS